MAEGVAQWGEPGQTPAFILSRAPKTKILGAVSISAAWLFLLWVVEAEVVPTR